MLERKQTLSSWVSETVNLQEHKSRIYNILDIKNYLLRKHKVLLRKDFEYKGKTFETAKVLLKTLKSILTTHVSYVVGNQISTTGNEDAYPVYDENYNYTHFIEHWQDILTSSSTYIVYYPDKVEAYKNSVLVDSEANISGLPICYSCIDKSAYDHLGDSMMNDLIPIMDKIEELLSYLDDTVKTTILNPVGVVSGQRIEESIPKEIVGAIINLEEGSSFSFPSLSLDYNNIKMLLNTYVEELYAMAGILSVVFGRSNVANLSETSLQMLYSSTYNKAQQMIYSLKDGMFKRLEQIRKLLKIQGITLTDDDFDSLDFTFSLSHPVDSKNLMEELKIQYEMGAISKKTIIDISPHTNDVAMEISRIEEESAALKENTTDNV